MFWNEIYDLIRPIVGPFLDPILEQLQNAAFRLFVLNSIILISVILSGAVYIMYEIPGLLRWMTSDSLLSPTSQRSTHIASQSHRLTRKTVPSQHAQVRPSAVGSGESITNSVRVVSLVSLRREGYLLTVTIENISPERLDMVMVSVNPPSGIAIEVGSFRMQRLGTIMPREKKSALVNLKYLGGNLSEIGGYVEFLGRDFGRMPLPPPKLPDQEESVVSS